MTYRVLVVEDDEHIQRLLTVALEHAGCVVECTSDTGDAISRLRGGGFDAVILDIVLGHQYGLDVLTYLVANDRSLASRTVVVTAYAEDVQVDIHDICHLVKKPFDLDTLVADVLKCAASKG